LALVLPGGTENTLLVLTIPGSHGQSWWIWAPTFGFVYLHREHCMKAHTACRSQCLQWYFTTLSSAITVLKIP
jgi:hypothetical protein